MTGLSVLAVLERQHTGTPVADCISARIGELKVAQAAASAAAIKRADDEARAKAEAERQRLAMLEQQRQDEVRKVAEAEAARKRCDGVAAQVGSDMRCLKPGDSFKDCPECPEMVVVPPGSFTMGSAAGEQGRDADEGPQHNVSMARPFAVGKFEVMFAEWDACVATRACKHKPEDRGWGRGNRPVINISWDHITLEYLPWLTRKSGKTYRLLTEAEWEYAARAGKTTPFSTGHTITTDQANFDGRSIYGDSAKGQYRRETTEVGSFKPNAFGLHDMHGNVWEWVEDCYRNSYAGAPTDGSAVISSVCTSRVLRGGSWESYAWHVRSAVRRPDSRQHSEVGFRLARTLSP